MGKKVIKAVHWYNNKRNSLVYASAALQAWPTFSWIQQLSDVTKVEGGQLDPGCPGLSQC